jgi:hypothetical protein
VPRFTEDNLQRIIINPFYAITVAPQLTEEHEPPLSEAEWVQANASLMREMGSERWLRQLLDVLEGKVGAPEQPINPSRAVNIDPLFAAEHPPLIEREMWVDVNVMQIRNMGAEGWLRQLLDVLNGDIVTAEEVGFAPPGGPFGYGVPGRSHPQRREKETEKEAPQVRRERGCRVTLFESSERLGGKAWPNTHGRDARQARLEHLPCLEPEERLGGRNGQRPNPLQGDRLAELLEALPQAVSKSN